MPKKERPKIEVIDHSNGHCTIQKGEDKMQLNFDDVQHLILLLTKHFNEYDKLPF